MQQDFLVHAPDDVVGVAVHDTGLRVVDTSSADPTRLHRTA